MMSAHFIYNLKWFLVMYYFGWISVCGVFLFLEDLFESDTYKKPKRSTTIKQASIYYLKITGFGALIFAIPFILLYK